MSHACSQSAWSNMFAGSSYPCYPPALGVALVAVVAVVAVVVVVILGKHIALGHLRGIELAAAKDARRRVHHGRAGGVEAIVGGVHGGCGCGRGRGREGFSTAVYLVSLVSLVSLVRADDPMQPMQVRGLE